MQKAFFSPDKRMSQANASLSDDALSSTTNGSINNIDRVERGFLLQPYIDKKGGSHLKDHKYSGSDDGFAYIYFYSPLATYLVSLLP